MTQFMMQSSVFVPTLAASTNDNFMVGIAILVFVVVMLVILRDGHSVGNVSGGSGCSSGIGCGGSGDGGCGGCGGD
jgi:hypothetical protein